ncbi:HEAT repeat domain-containing protein [Lignipirellula cremea]|nr:HEAT repeat domain-containing protein [Lignipirellula cremea]
MPNAPTPNEALPEVAPPTAGFILQLFLIPLIIVSIIVMVWLMFSWLALTTEPRSLVKDIKSGDDAAWQNLGALADILRNPEYQDVKKDQDLAQALSNQLMELQRAGHTDQTSLRLQVFLCRALGEFEVETGLPALLDAAVTERDMGHAVKGDLAEIDVRRAALQGISVLAGNLGPETLQQNQRLMQMLEKTAYEKPAGEDFDNRRAELRSTAAYALGVIGGEKALTTLDVMLGDPYANTRYNAATGLARHGDVRAIPVLLEMLSVDNAEAVKDEPFAGGRKFRSAMIWANGARAAQMLAEENPTADLQSLQEAITKLQAASPPREVATILKEVQAKLAEPVAAEPAGA